MKPLTALLSQAFVAFVIECDNDFERRVPHRTTMQGDAADERLPWLNSIGMWALYLRHIDGENVTAREFARRAGLPKEEVRNVLERLVRWWGYIEIVPPANGSRAEKSSWVLRPTPGGAAAFRVWRTLAEEVEYRWQTRFGSELVGALRGVLEGLGDALGADAPYVPIGNYGMFAGAVRSAPFNGAIPLYALFARLLLAAARAVEDDRMLSMAMGDNVVRAIAHEERLVRELPDATGISSRAIASSITFLAAKKLIAETRRGRLRAIALNERGRGAWTTFEKRRDAVELDWRDRAGADAIETVRRLLERIVHSTDGTASVLGSGLIPTSNGWRAAGEHRRQTEAFVANPARNLPHFPVVAHRGAWPDGS
jgi:hypothetical protein